MTFTYRTIGRNWKSNFEALLLEASQDVVLCSPFISMEGAKFVSSVLAKSSSPRLNAKIVTDLSPATVAQGANDPSAILKLAKSFISTEIFHLPRLHAKIYIADSIGAIVTSGNLTGGGLERNYEYGVEIRESKRVKYIRSDVLEYSRVGAYFDVISLQEYADRAKEVQMAYKAAQANIGKNAHGKLNTTIRRIGDDLFRRYLDGGPINAIFAKTIIYILRRHNELETKILHEHIQEIHPDICDDTVDRVIDGEHFGKKWKHQVRSAQSHLKRKGWIELINGKWRIDESSRQE